MQTPAQIVFHQLPASPALEAEIGRRIGELENVFDRIVSCRVMVEGPSGHQHHGGVFAVHIDLHVPGADIVVDRTRDGQVEHEDPYVAVHDAFRAARRQLEDHVRRRRGDVKHHGAS